MVLEGAQEAINLERKIIVRSFDLELDLEEKTGEKRTWEGGGGGNKKRKEGRKEEEKRTRRKVGEMRMDRPRGTFVVAVFHGVPQEDVSMVCFVSCCGTPWYEAGRRMHAVGAARRAWYTCGYAHKCAVGQAWKHWIEPSPATSIIPAGFPPEQLVAWSPRAGQLLNYIF